MSTVTAEEDVQVEQKDVKPSTSPIQGGMGVLSRLFSFSPLGNKTEIQPPLENKSPKNEEPAQVYYGVFVPWESRVAADDDSGDLKKLHVYTDRVEALKVVKKYKKARFKVVNIRQEAVAFALRGAEPLPDRGPNHSLGDSVLGVDVVEAPQAMSLMGGGEKPSQFRGPKPQEMVQFRKLIEAGDLNSVRSMVWENPRYLVSSGDTPSILQEGSRYNALHYAVKTNNIEMCDFVLSTISDPQFVQLLFGDDNAESSKSRAAVLLDLYLNMPDKAMNETPLHFAVKYGAKEIVDLLVSYPQCSMDVVNKFGEQPKDIICSRAEINSPTLVKKISSLLRERFYVPVLHSEDASQQPIIGEPFSPASPPNLNCNPISPRVEIRAFAGPMERGEANCFRRRWKTPPRSAVSFISTGPLASPKFRLQDVHKGLERVGRELAQKMSIGWREYWPFLDTFTDLKSEEGLSLLENYLKEKYVSQWNNSSNSVILSESTQFSPKTPVEDKPAPLTFAQKISFSPSRPGKNLDSTVSPMSDLCAALKSCNLNDTNTKYKSDYGRTRRKISESTTNQQNVEDENVTNMFLSPGLNPYLYVEKSCLVFAKRITLGLTYALALESDMVLECLKSETKHLQQTVASYMDDPRFYTVDFHLIHSRVAQLIAQKLRIDLNYIDDLDTLKSSLKDIAHSNNRNSDLFSSDEDEPFITYRASSKEGKNCIDKKNRKKDTQVTCMAGNILKWIIDKRTEGPIKDLRTEEECIDMWSDLYKCHCTWQTEQFFRNHRKNASLKRSQIKSRDGHDLSTSPKTGIDIVSRRLKFDNDDRGEERENCGIEINSRSLPKSDKNHNIPNDTDHRLSRSLGNHFVNVNPDESQVARLRKENPDLFSSDEEFESDNDVFLTPLSSASPEFLSSEESDYEEADDGNQILEEPAALDVFIHGDAPTKMDKAVYEAIFESALDREKFPYVYRWRHAIALHAPGDMESWPTACPDADESGSPMNCSLSLGHVGTGALLRTSTPSRRPPTSPPRDTPPLHVSKWLRVTGPNTPRSAFANKNFRPNVSFGF